MKFRSLQSKGQGRLESGIIHKLSNSSQPDLINALSILVTFFNDISISNLSLVIRTIQQERHGGAVWILNESGSTDAKLTIKYPIMGGLPFQPIQNPHSLGPKDISFLQSIANLSLVDGAILIDHKLQVHGFGAFITPEPQNFINHLGEIKSSDTLGGGRIRSAVTFCALHHPSAAIVVSSDSNTYLVHSEPELKTPRVILLSILGFGNN